MELKELENFVAIAEYENISKAARQLNIAQPPLTRQLKKLEEELSVQLFVREKKRLHITREGEYLKQQAKEILELTRKTTEQVKEMHDGVGGTLFIGAIETIGTALLPQWIADFKACYPGVRYNLWSGNSDDVLSRLTNGLIDVALVRGPIDKDKYNSLPILREPWIVMVNSAHAKAKQSEPLTLSDLAGEELIVPTRRSREIQGWFTAAGLQANIMCEFAPLMNAVALVEKNLGIAICPSMAKAVLDVRDVTVLELADPNLVTEVYLVWRKDIRLSHTTEVFLSFLRKNAVSNIQISSEINT